MKAPRFNLRSLLLVVIFAALALGVVLLSLENARLRRRVVSLEQRNRKDFETYLLMQPSLTARIRANQLQLELARRAKEQEQATRPVEEPPARPAP
jgi:hypothetical protein